MDQEIHLEIEVFDDHVGKLVADHQDLIKEEVRAAELGEVEEGHEKEWVVECVTMRFRIEPLGASQA